MTIKLALSFVALTCAAACGSVDPSDWNDTDQSSQAIVGGRLAPNGADPMVVKLGPDCTATKIGPRRFLTAAHCGFTPGTISLTNRSDGTGSVFYGIARVWVHPTYRNQTASQPGYDVALVDLTTDTPHIPIQFGVHPSFVGIGVTGSLTAYGMDPFDSSHDRRKQYEFFTTAAPPSNVTAAAAIPFFYEPAGGFAVHCGDDGGPFFIKTGSTWRLAGVAREPVGVDCATTPEILGTRASWFTRVANIRGWMSSPIENAPGGPSFLLNKRSNKCLTSALQQGTCDGRAQPIDPQYWSPEQFNGFYRFRNTAQNGCFRPGPETFIAPESCDAAQSINWFPTTRPGETEFVWIVSRTANTCLSIQNGSTADNAPLIHEPCNFTPGANPSQNWLFVR